MSQALSSEQQEYIVKMHKQKVRPEAIAAAFQRQYRSLITAQQIADFLAAVQNKAEVMRQSREIQEQLSTHDGELRRVRDVLRDIFEDENRSVRERIEAAKEIRMNIMATQKMASMHDDQGEFRVVLVVNDQVESGPVIDVESRVV